MSIKIAIMVHNLRMGVYEGMEAAARMGVTGVHLSASREGFRPSDLDAAGRRKLVAHVKSLGLEFSAISAWGGSVDLGKAENWQENIEAGKTFLEYAADLECGIWQGHCGIMPHSSADPVWDRFVDAFGQLCEYGEKVGACLAIETGPEPPKVLGQMIEEVGSKALRVNYDPANLILWPAAYMKDNYDREKAFDEYRPVEGVKDIGKYTVHVHAKDGKVFPEGRREVPLGEGWVDWERFVALLKKSGFDGYYAVEREVGDDPVGDITRAVEFLKTL